MVKSDLQFWSTTNQPTNQQNNANFDRLMYWSGFWLPGPYEAQEVVWHAGGAWVCRADTIEEPTSGSPDWVVIAPQTGRGGMESTPGAIGDITAAFQPLNFDVITQPAYGMTLSPASNVFTSQWPGWWEVRLSINLSFTETQASRFTEIRLWDVTIAAQIGTAVRVPIGRNQDGFLINSVFRFLVTPATAGNVFRLDIGGGDVLSGVTLWSNVVDFTQMTPSEI